MPAPVRPARIDPLARLQIERQAEAERRLRVGIVGRRHADVHDRVALGERQLFLAPTRLEEALDAAVVAAMREILAGAHLREHVVRRRPCASARGTWSSSFSVFGQSCQVDEIEIGVARMVGDRAPVLRVFHPVDDRAVAARRLAEAAAMLARGERAELAVDEGNDLAASDSRRSCRSRTNSRTGCRRAT